MSRKTAVQVPFVIGEFHELTGLTAPLRTTLHLPSTAPPIPCLVHFDQFKETIFGEIVS